jgi:hypothetical protein
MTINLNEKLNENLLKTLGELAVLIDKCENDEIFQHRFNKSFKDNFHNFGKLIWSEFSILNDEITKTFIARTYKLPNGQKIDFEKFKEKFNVNI